MRLPAVGFRVLVPAALLGLALVGPSTCARLRLEAGKGSAAVPSSTAYVYVVDWSGSTAAMRRRLLGAALAEMESLPEGTRVAAFRMGSETQEVFDGTLGEAGTDAVAAALARDALPSDARKGTDFSRMARALASFSRAFAGRRLIVRVLTDGGDDRAGDLMARAAYRKAAGELCADRRLTDLAFVGVAPGFREALREAFGKAGARLRVLGPGEPLGG